MKFIESYELREWVKDNLRKTIFQKAHALAVQTGCEILVKMHDSHDISGCQFYATTNLKPIYRNSKLRQPGETLVSGETGLPLMDKCIQYGEDASASTESSVPDEVQGNGGGGGGDVPSGFQADGMAAVPMQLSSTEFSNFNSQTQTSQVDANDADSDIEITQITNPQNLMAQSVQVKQEPSGYEQQQQNPMYAPQQQVNEHNMLGNQGMMANQIGNYQAPIAPKPYQCSICRKAFKSVHVLQKHTLTFHTTGGAGSRSRGRGRGSKGNRGRGTRGRGLKMTISRTHVGQQQQYQALPVVKTEGAAAVPVDPNSTTCTLCNQTFEQHDQLQAHIPQCPVAQQQQQQQGLNQFADPNLSGSLDASGFPTEFPQSASQDDPATSQVDWQQQFMPPDGSSPSGLNLPSASSFFGQQQNPSTSMYSTPTQSPRASGSGGSGSRGSRQQFGKLGQHSDPSKRNIMAAILQTRGPVVEHKVVVWNWKFLKMLSSKQFKSACNDLHAAGLGTVVNVQSAGGRPCMVFLKKAPDEIAQALADHPDLCSVEHYYARYNLPVSKSVSLGVRHRLAQMGVIPAKLLK